MSNVEESGQQYEGLIDQLTKPARNVLVYAEEEARRFQHNYIGTEHLLLGLVRESESVAAKVLASHGTGLNKVRSAVSFIVGQGDRVVLGKIGLSPRLKKVIKLAVDEARRLNHHYVGTEHLLLALINEGESIAVGILESLDVNLEKVRMQITLLFSQGSQNAPQTGKKESSQKASPNEERKVEKENPYIQEHLDILRQGVEIWNQWRQEHSEIRPQLAEVDLSGADLRKANLSEADLRDSNLYEANLEAAFLLGANLQNARLRKATLAGIELSEADLRKADLYATNAQGADLNDTNLSEANLEEAFFGYAHLIRANLSKAKLSFANFMGATLEEANLNSAQINSANLKWASLVGADLKNADLRDANLGDADLSGADLSSADLSNAILVNTNLRQATLNNCRVYGVAVWNVQVTDASQLNLIITRSREPEITIDNLKIAQFIYLLLNNAEIRDAIDTIARKAVLILGRFTPERKAVLDTLREALRTQGYVPILFDFDKPSNRNFTETVRTLAHLSRFIIADLTDSSSIPQELYAIVPTLVVPVQPVLLEGKREYAIFVDLLKTYHWVLPIHYYLDQVDLLATLKEQVIEPAERKAQELEKR